MTKLTITAADGTVRIEGGGVAPETEPHVDPKTGTHFLGEVHMTLSVPPEDETMGDT